MKNWNNKVSFGLLGLAVIALGPVQSAQALEPTPWIVGAPQDATALPSQIVSVTVYHSGALVTREARLQQADGRFVIKGVPIGADLNSLRLRGRGCEVLSMETRRRVGMRIDPEQLDTLNLAVFNARAAVARIEDSATVAKAVLSYHMRVEDTVQRMMANDLSSGTGDPSKWMERAEFVKNNLLDARVEVLKVEDSLSQAREALKLAESELKGGGRTHAPDTYDVIVDLVDLPTKDIPRLELDYFVGQAAWAPRHDLRAASDLKTVDLVYHAAVRQDTGEDWNAVPLVLSTAVPNRGASGPDPMEQWVGLWDPKAAAASAAPFELSRRQSDALEAMGYVGEESERAAPATKAWEPSYADVDASGLAVRFRLPRQESVPTGAGDQVFTVGRASTALAAEHVAAPSLNNLVWMRGKGSNDTPWHLLPGPAAVFVGGDFVGDAYIDTVAVGDEFTLPLGVDQGLSIERTRVTNEKGTRGFLSSKNTQIDDWRLVVTNYGGMTGRADGVVRVIVQEVLPTSTYDSLRVTLRDVTPPLSTSADFKEVREEKGILTWELDVPKNGQSEIRWGYEVRWPEGRKVSGL